MIGAENIVCKIAQMIKGCVGPILGIEDMHGIFNGLYMRYNKQIDSNCLREVLRMPLKFPGSSRWCSVNNTQHFEMLGTVEFAKEELLKCRRFVRDGVMRTMYEKRLDPLRQQLVNTIRSELDLMTQWGECSVK